MKRYLSAASFAICLLTVDPAVGQDTPAGLSSLDGAAWLAGCWRRASGDVVTDEQWMVPRAGLMMGMSRTVRGGVILEFERLLLRAVDGRIEYVADPSGQREATFTAVSPEDSLLVFVNEAHDFPQRIVYRRAAPDELEAYIEGVADGQSRRVDFPMSRVSCEALASG